MAIFLMGTDESNNNLHETLGGYEHISPATEAIVPTWDMLRRLRKDIVFTKNTADWLDALIVALDFLRTELA